LPVNNELPTSKYLFEEHTVEDIPGKSLQYQCASKQYTILNFYLG